jgi:hypothetical protein
MVRDILVSEVEFEITGFCSLHDGNGRNAAIDDGPPVGQIADINAKIEAGQPELKAGQAKRNFGIF